MYELSAILEGHTNDVRSISSYPGNCLVSGSRDKTVKLWGCDGNGQVWSTQVTYEGHKSYVSCLAIMPPNETHPDGLIYTGSNDAMIRAYVPHNCSPDHVLQGHSANVSSLFVSKNQTLLSGSWDTTARVWLNQKTVMTLKDHEAAVWCGVIMSEVGLMVTGAADGMLKVWKAGSCKNTIKAHGQAIRDLVMISRDELATCSNDGRINFWRVDCTTFNVTIRLTFEGPDFVYSLCAFDGGARFASAGENTGVRVFQDGKFSQTLAVPAISAWCVKFLENGDIAVGCSDNRIYIFSMEPNRKAGLELMALYDAEIARFQQPPEASSGSSDELPEEVGGVKVADMPGPEVLSQPGRREGQTIMVKDGRTISVHSWSAVEGSWKKVGDVVGQPDGKDPSGRGQHGGRVMFEGVEYDHVFHIDIDEGVVLKLPYNNGQEPYRVAQDFIYKHQLPQEYLDQIAQFIIKNSSGGGISFEQGMNCDPLTGGGAYVSGSGGARASSFTNGGGACDPFTGGSAYVSESSGGGAPTSNGHAPIHDFYPLKDFLKFSAVPKADALKGKLQEFNSKAPESLQLKEGDIDKLLSLVNQQSLEIQDVSNLVKTLRWPKDLCFPCIDLVRLALVDAPTADLLLSKHSEELLDILLQNLSLTDKAANQMLALRSLANLFSTDKGMKLMLNLSDTIIQQFSALFPLDNKQVQIAMSTVLLNYAVAFTSHSVSKESQVTCLSLCLLFVQGMTDSEARFRNLVTLGTLLESDASNCQEARKQDAREKIDAVKMLDTSEKVQQCAKALLYGL